MLGISSSFYKVIVVSTFHMMVLTMISVPESSAELKGGTVEIKTSYRVTISAGGQSYSETQRFTHYVYFSKKNKIYFSFGNSKGHIIDNPNGGKVAIKNFPGIRTGAIIVDKIGSNKFILEMNAIQLKGGKHGTKVVVNVNGHQCRSSLSMYIRLPTVRTRISRKSSSCRYIVGRKL